MLSYYWRDVEMEIDIEKMTQTNKKMGTVRQIRLVYVPINGSCSSSSSCSSGSSSSSRMVIVQSCLLRSFRNALTAYFVTPFHDQSLAARAMVKVTWGVLNFTGPDE